MSSRSRLHYYYHYNYPSAPYKSRPYESNCTFKREWSPASSQSSYSSGSSSPTYSPVQQGYYPPQQTYYWNHVKPSNYYFESYV